MITSASYLNPLHAVAGGDIAFVLPIAQGEGIRVVNGDVCNHGRAAYPIRAPLELALRELAQEERPSRVLQRANLLSIEKWKGDGRFATVIVVDLVPKDGVACIRIASAGHWPPIAVAEGGVLTLEAPDPSGIGLQDLPLGIDGGCRYTEKVWKLNDLRALLVYSDGFAELPVGGRGQLLGLQQLAEDFARAVEVGGANPHSTLSALRTVIDQRAPKVIDDMSCIVVSVTSEADTHTLSKTELGQR